jgi:hypothetical protein
MPTINRHELLRPLPTVVTSLAIVLGCNVFCCLSIGLAEDSPSAQQKMDVDFERHIAPLFGRLGCNSAACHGAFGGGKGGLQLSLFGYSAKMDYLGVDDRIDKSDAEASLLLLKPSGREEHEGGVRFEPKSNEYLTIRRWIEQGARWQAGSGSVKSLTVTPTQVVFDGAGDSVSSESLAITAEFSDGSRELVTHLCQFTSRDEGVALVDSSGKVSRSDHGDTSIIVSYGNAFAAISVLAPHPKDASGKLSVEVSPTNSIIDKHVNEKLSRLNIVPSGSATDEEFLRRVMLDTIGAIPTPDNVLSFCADARPDKRERKIDELLSHPMHAALWATRMCDITKCDIDSRQAQMWHDWFRRRFADNTSYAEIVRGVVTSTSREGLDINEWMQREEQLVHASRESFENNYAERDTLDLYWRREGDDSEATLKANAELTAAAFTGVRLNCAQCHKHPFDRWTQDDYAAFANIFSSVIYGSSTAANVAIIEELARRREAKKTDKTIKSLPRLREVFVSEELGRRISGSEPGFDVAPRAFGSAEFTEKADIRPQFYAWLVASDNPFFSRNFVNRVWAVYFGSGFVDPVDDFSVTNPPSHPALLDELAAKFRESEFDIRELEKTILMSAAYQRSATPNKSNRNDRRNFSRQRVRPLMAEVVMDAINRALGTSEDFGDDARQGALAIEIGKSQIAGDAGRMLNAFGRGKRESICDCDRRTQSDLRQFLFMVNDRSITTKIQSGSVRQLLSLEDEQLVTRLYLRILGRKPQPPELEVGLAYLLAAEVRDVAFDDLVWALVNSREFITNH